MFWVQQKQKEQSPQEEWVPRVTQYGLQTIGSLKLVHAPRFRASAVCLHANHKIWT